MLHMLTLLKDLLPCFPEGLVKSCSETLLRVMTLNHVVSSCPSACGCTEAGAGRASDPRPVCWHSGSSLFRPEAGVGASSTLLLATPEDTSHPWGGADGSASAGR